MIRLYMFPNARSPNRSAPCLDELNVYDARGVDRDRARVRRGIGRLGPACTCRVSNFNSGVAGIAMAAFVPSFAAFASARRRVRRATASVATIAASDQSSDRKAAKKRDRQLAPSGDFLWIFCIGEFFAERTGTGHARRSGLETSAAAAAAVTCLA